MTNNNGFDPNDLLANLEARLRPPSPQLQTEPSGVMGEGDFYSPDEIHETLEAYSQSYNAGPITHFLGLSPDQVVYQPLFRAYVDRFNWGYLDGYQSQGFVGASFLFSLFLLSRLGGRWRSEVYYREKFVRAFPSILAQVEAQVHSTPKEELGHILTMRVFERFCALFGLAETEARQEIGTWRRDIRIRSLPLLKEVVQFKV